MLRKVDCRWEILCLPVSKPNLGTTRTACLAGFASQTNPADLEPDVVVLSYPRQRWQEAFRGRPVLPWSTGSLRLEVRTIQALSRRDFSRVSRLLERRPVGRLYIVSRWNYLAQQT